jgi:hypothetical protein
MVHCHVRACANILCGVMAGMPRFVSFGVAPPRGTLAFFLMRVRIQYPRSQHQPYTTSRAIFGLHGTAPDRRERLHVNTDRRSCLKTRVFRSRRADTRNESSMTFGATSWLVIKYHPAALFHILYQNVCSLFGIPSLTPLLSDFHGSEFEPGPATRTNL